jgi:hypothetical protein
MGRTMIAISVDESPQAIHLRSAGTARRRPYPRHLWSPEPKLRSPPRTEYAASRADDGNSTPDVLIAPVDANGHVLGSAILLHPSAGVLGSRHWSEWLGIGRRSPGTDGSIWLAGFAPT